MDKPSAVIDVLMTRAREGRCTFRQARTLLRHGVDPDVSFCEASTIITRLAAHGWRRPAPAGG